MKQEYKELLLKDLCARLPYKTQCRIKYIINNETTGGEDIEQEIDDEIIEIRLKYQEVKTDWVDEFYDISCIKPYLRPMSSMTEEEKRELQKKYVVRFSSNDIRLRYHSEGYWDNDLETFHSDYLWLGDWLLSHHFDIRGLIEKGLALEAPEGMYGI